MAVCLLIILFGIFLGVTIYNAWRNSSSQKGKRGEARIHAILTQLPDEYFILNDVVFPTKKGTTQIDHIVVSKYGVFAIETKNYQGDIYGNDDQQEWKQIIVSEVTYPAKPWKTYTYVTNNQFYNPVKQAVGHMYHIKELLKDWPYLKVVPIVVFVGEANLSKVYSRDHVIYASELLSTIQSYKTSYINDGDVRKIALRLSQKDIRKLINNKTHVRNVKAVKREIDSKISSGICPKCGGTLVMRNGKYGQFLGCVNYPHCKFTAKL